MAVVHQCRREPEAALEWAEATIAAAQQLGYVYREAMGRVLRGWALAQLGDADQGVREITARAGRLARHRRADGRPALPRAAGRGAPARRATLDAGLAAVAEALELARRERSLFYEPELHRLDGALHAAAGRADVGRGLRCGAASRARASRARTRSSCGSRPTSRGCSRDPRRRRRGARRRSRRVHAGFDEGRDTRDLREAAAVLGAAARQAITPAPASASTSVAEHDAVGDEHHRRVAASSQRSRKAIDA